MHPLPKGAYVECRGQDVGEEGQQGQGARERRLSGYPCM